MIPSRKWVVEKLLSFFPEKDICCGILLFVFLDDFMVGNSYHDVIQGLLLDSISAISSILMLICFLQSDAVLILHRDQLGRTWRERIIFNVKTAKI